MSRRLSLLEPLKGAQADASDPRHQVWLSASAGTGKTHVLTARVLRLLLTGAAPESILCLTFTKAGAAEMAERIQGRLAGWVRMREQDFSKELYALGERHDDAAVRAARRLFARVLDAPGGGLRIQTIHAFAQTLLAGFPVEAGLAPGFAPLDGRAEGALARATLAEMLVTAERGGDLGLIRDVQTLSHRLGEQRAEQYLLRCARAPDALAALGFREGITAKVRTALDVPLGDVEQAIHAACADDAHDCQSLDEVLEHNRDWGTKSGIERAEAIGLWRSEPSLRGERLADLHLIWATKDGTPRSFGKGQAPPHSEYAETAMRLHGWATHLLGLRARAELADLVAAGLRAGQSYTLAYAAAKRAAGAVDFDDLIRAALALLQQPGIGEWIRYKLDRRTDHVLVDEAQDTNAAQWTIVRALTEEFFVEEPEDAARRRTIFAVGDFKQAIFGFQGTNPQAFEAARQLYERDIAASGRRLNTLSLDRSFRSSPAVLTVVDRLIEQLGDRLGLPAVPDPHLSAHDRRPGLVTLLRPVSADTEVLLDEGGEEDWIDDATRLFATKLARQVRAWLDDGLWLAGRGRALRPEDVLVLVRRRGTLAALIVARLHAEGVAVAGIDRLRLDAPLAVKDLMAAIRFALQPEDDLNLASLLVSPLIGLSQDDLYALGFGRRGSLWAVLRDVAGHGESAAILGEMLNAADFTTPHRFLERILSGPLDGRRKLLARLGGEARDPIDELLGAALAFEGEATPTLQRFLDWFDRDEVEVTRDPSAPLDAVRVMTAHGAKGLQAPLVILADATGNPDAAPTKTIAWAMAEDAPPAPIFRPRKAELAGSLADSLAAIERREREEHWRLLYVAATRAEEHLIIGGALGPRAKGVPPADSWYQAADTALASLGGEWVDDPIWTGSLTYIGAITPALRRREAKRRANPARAIDEPDWLRRAAPREARPPRPLAPSSLGEDRIADPPPSLALRAAAERGKLLHALFERLPAVATADRISAGERWLAAAGGVDDPALRRELVHAACAIIADPAHAALFAPDALAEAPIAAVVAGGMVVAGTVDRLVVRDDHVLLVDFKTGRRVPDDAAAIPEHHLRQMAAYAAALAVIFPDRPNRAALLYTAGPLLIDLPAALLDRYKPGLAGEEQMQGDAG